MTSVINLKSQFSIKGDGSDETAAINAAFASLLGTGVRVQIDAGPFPAYIGL